MVIGVHCIYYLLPVYKAVEIENIKSQFLSLYTPVVKQGNTYWFDWGGGRNSLLWTIQGRLYQKGVTFLGRNYIYKTVYIKG